MNGRTGSFLSTLIAVQSLRNISRSGLLNASSTFGAFRLAINAPIMNASFLQYDSIVDDERRTTIKLNNVAGWQGMIFQLSQLYLGDPLVRAEPVRWSEWLASRYCSIDIASKRLRWSNLPARKLRPKDDFQSINNSIFFTNVENDEFSRLVEVRGFDPRNHRCAN